jgi:hypothetical protein
MRPRTIYGSTLALAALVGACSRTPTTIRADDAHIESPRPKPEPPPVGDIVIGKSIGALRVGMRIDEVKKVLGEPDEVSNGVYYSYHRRGLCILYDDGGVGAKVLFAYTGRKGGYEKDDWTPFRERMPAGLTLDSTLDDVVRVLGPPDSRGELDTAPIPSTWFQYDRGIGFDFVTATGQLVYLHVSAPEVK